MNTRSFIFFTRILAQAQISSLIFRGLFYYVTISPSRSARCETNKPPAMRVRIEGYTKKLQTRYNKGVQANCKAKGEKYGTKGSFVLFLFQLTIFLYFFFLSL